MVNSGGRSSRAQVLFVSGNFFPTLGGHPAFGRLLDSSDDSASAVPAIVVSHGFWQRKMGGDPTVVGKRILVDKMLFTVAGVTAAEFPELDPGLPSDLWLPLASRPSRGPQRPKETAANALWIELMARLQPDVTLEQATSAVSGVFAASTTNGPDAMFKTADAPQIELAPAATGLATLRRNYSQPLFALLAAVGITLLISCANIAGLMLARSAARRKELVLRVALGATRGRIIRQLLTESLLLSVAGGMAGILLGYVGADTLVSFLSHNWRLPLQLDVHPDARVLVFTLLISVLVGVAFGLAPAFLSRRSELAPVLREVAGGRAARGSTHRNVFGNSLVLGQLALAMPVLTGAGLVVRTLANLNAEDVGFDPQKLVVFRLDSTYSSRAHANRTFYNDLQGQLSSLPGVTSASRSGVLLLSNEGMAGPIFSEAQSGAEARAHVLPMSSGFLKTMQIPLIHGRALNDTETERTGTNNLPTPVVVNEMLAHRLFGAQDPLGKRFRAGSADGAEHEIVGVIPDGKYGNVRDDIWPTVYTPIGNWDGPLYFEVRTAVDPNVVIPEIRSVVSHFDSDLLITDMKTQIEQIDQNIYQERLIAHISSLFAVLALLVACVGIYGLISYQVSRRTQEIGIRLALGAQRAEVLLLVLRQGTVLAVAGALLGTAASFPLMRYLQSFLFGVKPADPLTMAAVGVLLITVALLANSIPAWRAANVDPMVALRYE
jgi:predicted permease